VQTAWDAERFYERVKNKKVKINKSGKTAKTPSADENTDIFFKKATFGDLEDPVTILDAHGKVLAWSLPGVLHKNRLVRLLP
jgi:ribosomal protein S11